MYLRAIILIAALMAPAIAHAQPRRQFWGIDADVAPSWTAPDAFKFLFDADSIDVGGADFRIGFVRGAILRGEWGVAYVHRKLSNDALVVRNQGTTCPTCGSFLRGGGTTLDGIEIHKFAAIGRIGQRIQLGADVAGGIGQAKGTVRQTVVSQQESTPQSQETTVDATTLMSLGSHNLKPVPLLRADFVATALLGPDLKIRVATGLDLPGYSKVSVGVVYFINAR